MREGESKRERGGRGFGGGQRKSGEERVKIGKIGAKKI